MIAQCHACETNNKLLHFIQQCLISKMKNVSSLWEDMVNGDLKGSSPGPLLLNIHIIGLFLFDDIDCYGKDVLAVSTQNRKL